MNLRNISQKLEAELSKLFEELRSGIAAREDSRAFGAMIEHRIKQNWDGICSRCGWTPEDLPGRRTIFDFGFKIQETVVGIDVKTKDLDSTKYSDGGICAVGNLLKFLANDRGQSSSPSLVTTSPAVTRTHGIWNISASRRSPRCR